MAGRNYGTMNQGYYYDEAVNIGYNITVGSLRFSMVAYHSKGQLKAQLVHDGYNPNAIEEERMDCT